ncbi:MAG: hypothetical protein KME52_03720 [Desmonostoc geniculatum HA4340-LM1]|jgi:hypothetical protein|nr:hypothetical protein [Desmonostoc geniculatum HA4340-LM1]
MHSRKDLGRIKCTDELPCKKIIVCQINLDAFTLQVKARYSKTIDDATWKITEEEIEKNQILVCIYIQEKIEINQNSYSLIYAGFLPTSLMKNQKEVYLRINDLLYIGGLQNYLYSNFVDSPTLSF